MKKRPNFWLCTTLTRMPQDPSPVTCHTLSKYHHLIYSPLAPKWWCYKYTAYKELYLAFYLSIDTFFLAIFKKEPIGHEICDETFLVSFNFIIIRRIWHNNSSHKWVCQQIFSIINDKLQWALYEIQECIVYISKMIF